MKKQMKNYIRNGWLLMTALTLVMLSACEEDGDTDPVEKPIASFQFEVSDENFLEVSFTNFSQHATGYSWDFGDDNTSTDENPTHTYAEEGTFEVILTATNDAGESVTRSEMVEVTNPNSAAQLLTGSEGKAWQLIADVSTGRFPFEVGPEARTEIWWALGINEELCVRECVFDDTWTFNTDGTFTYENNGDYFGDAAVWSEELVNCFDASDNGNYVNSEGADISDWNSGTHDYAYDPSAKTLTIQGGFIGLSKVGNEAEFTTPQESVTYSVVELKEGDADTLVLETKLTEAGGYWRFVLVSYGDTSAPTVDECDPVDPDEGDLENITPTALFNTFASTDAADVDGLVPTESDVTITPGVDDPADAGAAKVGEYVRGTASFADLKFQQEHDVQFDNFETVSIDIYFPSTNTYSEGGLTQRVDIFLADASQDAEFWTTWELYVDESITAQDEWVTVTFDLGTALERDDIDLIGLKIGGENHAVDGTFYIRNFKFE